jgi:hypothetical protein
MDATRPREASLDMHRILIVMLHINGKLESHPTIAAGGLQVLWRRQEPSWSKGAVRAGRPSRAAKVAVRHAQGHRCGLLRLPR